MSRAIVIDADAANRLSLGGDLTEVWADAYAPPAGITRKLVSNILYLIGRGADQHSKLLIIPTELFEIIPNNARLECFQRILRASLSEFRPGLVKLPLEWRIFHSGSLVSFQSNRFQSGVSARAYVDVAPEGTQHVYAFHLSTVPNEPLTRASYDVDLFVDAVFGYEDVVKQVLSATDQSNAKDIGHRTVALTATFAEAGMTPGIPFRVWRDAKLTLQQRNFFDAPFDGPLRVKGPAGSGKTLVLAMRFLKEIYARLDQDKPVRAAFLMQGEETAQHVSRYLMQMDERGLLFDPQKFPRLNLEITTLHGLANRYINRDTENIQPLSLDGSEGRKMQFELIESIASTFTSTEWKNGYRNGCRPDFIAGIESSRQSPEGRSFTYDLSDEFANVLEAFGVRGIDEIGQRYLKARSGERALAKNVTEKRAVLELYRRFRQDLVAMGVVSLDQFTADFLAYLNSFRWDTLRKEKGFDFVFADELHLFNAQERRVLGFLLRESEPPRRVAVAYDPRQSPRNSFFPEATTERDTIWTEAGLGTSTKPFELTDVFRYTPQILAFLDRLNQRFPATDLAEDWAIKFGRSHVQDGPMPASHEYESQLKMAEAAVEQARRIARTSNQGENVAVLCLDHEKFARYREAGIFQNDFVIVSGRDELGLLDRFRKRMILSMPEYVAGLQFHAAIILDANADLVAELGGGVNGLHRFISSVYLGASRAKFSLQLFADKSAGGFAEPIRDSIESGLITPGK